MLKKLNLATKIGGGFAITLLLLLLISILGWTGISQLSDGLIRYRETAIRSNLMGSIQANLIDARLQVKNYVLTPSNQVADTFQRRFDATASFIEEATDGTRNPAHLAMMREAQSGMVNYGGHFTQVVNLIDERNERLAVLDSIGPRMEQEITSIAQSMANAGVLEAQVQALDGLRNLLLGRVYAMRFLDSHAMEHVRRVETELDTMVEQLDAVTDAVTDAAVRSSIASVKAMREQYKTNFEALRVSITVRDEHVAQMDQIGPHVADLAEQVKLEYIDEQNTLGPALQARGRAIVTMVLVASVIALISGIAVALLISRSIISWTQKAVTFTETLAAGDFTQSIACDLEDEIGRMIRALVKMGGELRSGFGEIQGGVQSLASSTTELSAISSQLSANAEQGTEVASSVASASEQTSHNMDAVAAAVEQMSTNIRSVATASEEMTATINEIAHNTENARNVTQTAVEKIRHSSSKMQELGTAAKLIDSITDTIKGISDQTNLLALNATIEAASAGDAGKGFAVVANEIKELSRQTAKATEQIAHSIENMQTSTDSSIQDFDEIQKVIAEIDQITALIASAVEEQSATTNEIAANVSQTADGVGEVSRNVTEVTTVSSQIAKDIHSVQESSKELAGASNQLNSSAKELSEFAEKINAIVDRYKV